MIVPMDHHGLVLDDGIRIVMYVHSKVSLVLILLDKIGLHRLVYEATISMELYQVPYQFLIK